MLPILLLLCTAFAVLTDHFASWQNLSIVAQQASINSVLAAGMTFVILTGGIDLSVGSILSISAVAAMLVSLVPQLGALSVPAALLCGPAFGTVNGALVAFMKLPPFIVTLGTLTAVRGLARLAGHDSTLYNPDIGFAFLGNGELLGVPWLVVIACAVVALCWFVLRRTVLGMQIYAVGGNAEAARLSGIKVWVVLLFVYAMSGLLSGLGGVMSAARLYAANGLQLGQSYELDAIAAVIRAAPVSSRHRLDRRHPGGRADHRGAVQRLGAAGRLRYLAVHRQGHGDHRRRGAGPLPPPRFGAHLTGHRTWDTGNGNETHRAGDTTC